MGATPTADAIVGTRDPTPMRHITTGTLRIAEALVSPFTLHPDITAIGTAGPHILIIGIAAGIVISKERRAGHRPIVLELDLVPLQIANLRGAQAMTIREQDHRRVAARA